MKFEWRHYNSDDEPLVNSWIDDSTIKYTGIDDGWQQFYDYWSNESKNSVVKDCCYMISFQSKPFAVIYLSFSDETMYVSEFIVAPEKRGLGLGTKVLKELLNNINYLSHKNIKFASAVIFPNNISSKRAFENAGFVLESIHPDGDALNYIYEVMQ